MLRGPAGDPAWDALQAEGGQVDAGAVGPPEETPAPVDPGDAAGLAEEEGAAGRGAATGSVGTEGTDGTRPEGAGSPVLVRAWSTGGVRGGGTGSGGTVVDTGSTEIVGAGLGPARASAAVPPPAISTPIKAAAQTGARGTRSRLT